MIAAISPEENRTETARPEPTHWMKGRYFVPMPDLSDETSWVISEGRAWPTFMAILRLLHQQERKGATEEIRHDAIEGRLGNVGVNGLASITGMTATAVLRQLRFLERQGLIRTHQERCTAELDPATGRFRKNYAKAPPKVILITIKDHHLRPTRAASAPQRDTLETNPRPSGDTPGTNPSGQNLRVRNRCVPKDSNLQRDWSPLDSNRRTAAAGRRPAAASAPGKAKPGAQQQPREQDWERKDREAKQERLAEYYADKLGTSKAEVIDLWKTNMEELRRRLIEVGMDPKTNRFPTPQENRNRRISIGYRDPYATYGTTTFDLRAKAVQAVSVVEDTGEAEERAAREAEWAACLAKASQSSAPTPMATAEPDRSVA